MVEVGTLAGYGAIWIASENPGLHVTTIEVNSSYAALARQNIERAGVADRRDIIGGRGLDVLSDLVQEVGEGLRKPFDLGYIDADKRNNWRYFDLIVQMGRPGMCVFVDNVVRRDGIVSEDSDVFADKSNVGARDLIKRVGKDDRVDSVVMQTVNEKSYDGLLMAVVNDRHLTNGKSLN